MKSSGRSKGGLRTTLSERVLATVGRSGPPFFGGEPLGRKCRSLFRHCQIVGPAQVAVKCTEGQGGGHGFGDRVRRAGQTNSGQHIVRCVAPSSAGKSCGPSLRLDVVGAGLAPRLVAQCLPFLCGFLVVGAAAAQMGGAAGDGRALQGGCPTDLGPDRVRPRPS